MSAPVASREGIAERVTLRDGSTVVIRPLEPREPAAIESWFMALEPHTRYERFHAALKRIDPRTLAELAGVDHRRHEALAAVAADGAIVGIGRYIRLADPAEAELAVTVVDPWQGRGVATALVVALARLARAAGIRTFRATCAETNHAAVRVIRQAGVVAVTAADAGVLDVRIELSTEGADRAAGA